MLFRAALIYCLAVTSLLFGVLSVWQRLELSASKQTTANMARRMERQNANLDAERERTRS